MAYYSGFTLNVWGQVSCLPHLVDLVGFEPTTFSMPLRRAPNCAIGPCNAIHQIALPVDLGGFEPPASSVRLRRAPSCATGPTKRTRLYPTQCGVSSNPESLAQKVRGVGRSAYTCDMRTQLNRLALTIFLAVTVLFSLHGVLLSDSAPATASALIEPDTCSVGQCQAQRPMTATAAYTLYLPLIERASPTVEEFRGLWITRFDRTRFGYTVTRSDLDAIVDKAAAAHFNALLFQVRGTADAYYSSTLEPWAARLTGSTTKTLGVNPGFDPLAYLITRAHQSGLQVHAYINIFPTWLCGVGAPPSTTTPQHLFWTLSHSATTWSAWRIYSDLDTPMNLDTCSDYLWATPALSLTRDHITAVAVDIVQRYDVDGLHLDLIRYPNSTYSFDPYTMQAFSEALQISPTLTITAWRPDFQRAQINAIMQQIYSVTTAIKPDLLVSAAVWFSYTDGYNNYFQDSKGWLANGFIDANLPMLYSSDILNDLPAWTTRAQGFLDDAHGRYVFPGISANYTDVHEIISRIEAARSLGAKGVALFSYGAMNTYDYWDDLANGSFANVATVPRPNWKP
jgi:uncharacterized lipoprotein YddW (UPF0748 family)